jgi:hypothetical protein
MENQSSVENERGILCNTGGGNERGILSMRTHIEFPWLLINC